MAQPTWTPKCYPLHVTNSHTNMAKFLNLKTKIVKQLSAPLDRGKKGRLNMDLINKIKAKKTMGDCTTLESNQMTSNLYLLAVSLREVMKPLCA